MTSTNTKRKRNQIEAKMTNCFLVKLSRKVAAIYFIPQIAFLCVLYKSAEGVLIQKPKDAITIVNQSTFFNCSKSINNSSSDLEELTWYHQPLGGVLTGVFEDGRVRDKYKGRFSIDKHETSIPEDIPFNLLVVSPESKDAGRYRCVEDVLKADKGASAELIVLDSNLLCESATDLDEIVGPTECTKSIKPDQLQLKCSVTYSGNLPPQMEWRKVGSERESNMTNCGVKGNRVMCNATLEANVNMDGSEYICQIKAAKQYNCSLMVKEIIYTVKDTSVRNITIKDEVFCSAKTSKNVSCSYKWYKDDQTEQFGQTLKPNNPGQYRCEAECKIRNETCSLTAMVVQASEPVVMSTEASKAWLIGGITAATCIGLLIAGCIIAIVVRRRKKKMERKSKKKSIKDVTDDKPESMQRPSADENHELLPKNENDLNDATEASFSKAPYIGRGLSGGEIHGPMQYEGRQCTCERITCTKDQQTQTNDGGMSKEDTICSLGQQWKALDHKNLVKFYDIVSRPPSVYIIMEYAAGGSVRNALKKLKDSEVNLPVVKDWATQIATGMEYLHGENIVHKHLSSTQVLIVESVDARGIGEKNLKISQFCLIADDFTSTRADEKFSFTPPEVFVDDSMNKDVEKEGDVWGFGIIVWEILTNNQPYRDVKMLTKIIADIQKGAKQLEIPDSCPGELKGILNGCRSLVPAKRPSFSAILKRLQEWNIVT